MTMVINHLLTGMILQVEVIRVITPLVGVITVTRVYNNRQEGPTL